MATVRLRALLLQRRIAKPPSKVVREDAVRALMAGEFVPVATDIRELKRAPADEDIHQFLDNVVHQSQTVFTNWWTNTQLTVLQLGLQHEPRSTWYGDVIFISIDDDIVMPYLHTIHGYQPL